MKKEAFIILLAAILVAACNRISYSNPAPVILNIRAYIDGRSLLILKGDAVYWHHLDFDAPGRWIIAEIRQPTYLNQRKWNPVWPDIPDSTNDSCNCASSVFRGIPSIARTNQRVWLDVVQGRGRVAVVQQPDAENDFTLILEFDDNYLEGAEWYDINLNYIIGAAY